jgi:hypothetical protein
LINEDPDHKLPSDSNISRNNNDYHLQSKLLPLHTDEDGDAAELESNAEPEENTECDDEDMSMAALGWRTLRCQPAIVSTSYLSC